MPTAVTHPTPQELTDFGLGKLAEGQAVTVAAHLATCADCRRAVAGLPPDSFLGKVRAAKPSASSLPPGASPSMMGKAAVPAAPPTGVPPELANHPKFRVLRELGRGGMGVVYEAEQTLMERKVAIKVINAAVLDHPEALARFHAEVKAAAKLNHDNIVRAHDAEQAGSLHLLVMEFVEGLTLAQLVERKGPLPVASACRCAHQAALGLQHAFEQGMVHRDIKPQNLMLTPQGRVKVLDFGLARMRSERGKGRGLTQADAFMGTPDYVAPEQATDARAADTRADVYSLGCTLYFLLTGRPPFVEDTAVKLVLAHIEKEPRPLSEVRPDMPPALSAVVARMLAKDPAQRYQTPVEVARALAPFVKAGGKAGTAGGASLPPGAKAPGRGTTVGSDTSRVKGLGQGASKLPGTTPAGGEKASPFDDLVDAPAPAPTGKKGKAAKPVPAARWKRPVVLAGAACAALAILVLASVIVKALVKSPDGDAVVVVEVDQPGAEVLVDEGKIAVKVPDDNQPVEIKLVPGQHKLRISKDGFEAIAKDLELKAGRSAPIRVRLEPVRARPKDFLQAGSIWRGSGEYSSWGLPGPSPGRYKCTLWITQRNGDRFKGIYEFKDGADFAQKIAGRVERVPGSSGRWKIRWEHVEDIRGDAVQRAEHFAEGTMDGPVMAVSFSHSERITQRVSGKGTIEWKVEEEPEGAAAGPPKSAEPPGPKDFLRADSTWRGAGENTFWGLSSPPVRFFVATLRVTHREGNTFKGIYEFDDGAKIASRIKGEVERIPGAPGKWKIRWEHVEDVRGNDVQRFAPVVMEGTMDGSVLTVSFSLVERVAPQRLVLKATIKFNAEADKQP
jgi:hypothetical protein